jgi:hypothetical protein
MDCYKCEDATERANRLSRMRQVVEIAAHLEVIAIWNDPTTISHDKRVWSGRKVRVTRREIISYGETELDLTGRSKSCRHRRQMLSLPASLPSLETAPDISLYDALKHLDGYNRQYQSGRPCSRPISALARARLLRNCRCCK